MSAVAASRQGGLPTFLIVGAAKCGTTALYYYLQQHPDVYMCPRREPNFFAMEGEPPPAVAGRAHYEDVRKKAVTDLASYRALFSGVAAERAVGEVSPFYLMHPRAPQRIRNHLPGVKLIAILRDPAERTYSQYLQYVRDRHEDVRDFESVLDLEDPAEEDIWLGGRHYVREAFYYAQLRRYYDLFPPDQLRVYLYEDLLREPDRFFADLLDFIGVDADVSLDRTRWYNRSGIPRREGLHRVLVGRQAYKDVLRRVCPPALWTRVRHAYFRHFLVRPPLSPEARARLVALYREDVLRLQELLQRDLSAWLEP